MNRQLLKLSTNKKSKKLLKYANLFIILSITFLLYLCFFGPLNIVFNHHFWVKSLQTYDCCTVPLFINAYIILTVLGIPGTVLTIVGGILFGIIWGTIWSVIGATLGALGAFLMARYLLRDYVTKKFNKTGILAQFQQAILKQPIQFVLSIRLAPISPFNVVNFLFGLTPINWLSYTGATLIGIIPGTFAYNWLGVSGNKALQGSDRFSFFLALGFLSLLSIIPFVFRGFSSIKSSQ
ncbi:TVP38/TMEM64 family protein [Crocosphaera sp. UHCC 0190]|uniref:TVP38/TMEM64 family protein n=1 Tax=Crocosphaera sp. UHCC 0190 TaxID=3110246 RepID=UPI002B1EA4F0|nr:TVP38/TMEM64 family protein [Crocosphaera sp. UHCC 0190]MEA5509671.1 TVP38/TMEM64 family protein [Crocosphaera sp. UHCC 0190]